MGDSTPLSQKYLHSPIIPLSDRPAKCGACPYGGVRVGSRGPVDAPFVLVGESPGSNELYKGYPFVGMSGDMMEETLKEVGWDPEEDGEPYVLNAMQCFPKNKDKDQATFTGATRACQERLRLLIMAHPRKVIVALGNAASWSLTNNFGIKITRDRGKLYKYQGSEMGVVTTVHPAFLMRQGVMFGPWKKDLAYAVSLLKGFDPKEGLWAPPTWSICQTREDYEEVVQRLADASYIAADTETGGRDRNGIAVGLHFQKGYILCLVLTSNLSNGRHVDIIPGPLFWEHEDLAHRLLGNRARWIWQNGKFDIKFYRYEGIAEARVDEDTMLQSYTMNENKGHDLDSIAWDWIGAPRHKDAIDNWFHQHRIPRKRWDYALVPKDILYKYAAYDVSKTYQAFWPMKAEIDRDPHLTKLYYDELIPGSEFLTHMEMRGMRLDPERIIENEGMLLQQMATEAQSIQAYAREHLGQEINIASWQQLQVLLYDKMKLGPSGSSTDEDALIRIQRRFNHPISLHLQRWRKHAKARGTYANSERALQWPGLDDRVHITFNLHRTTTGRLSSSDPTNLQNWPRDPQIRGAFIAEVGRIFVSVDLNQAELRCLAIMSGDPTLVDIYTRNEVSIHHITAVALFGEHYTDDEKMRAKAVNFGIVYGRTAPSLAEEFDISVGEADEYIKAWMARFPQAAKFIDWSRTAPQNQITLITNFGRKKRWGAISWDNLRNSENEAANFPHQSTAHSITLRAGIECGPIIRRLWDTDFVNEIHDDLMSEAPNDPDVYGPAIAYIQHVMQRVPRDHGLTRVPFVAEAKIGTRWGAKRNAKEAGITDPFQLDQYMTDFRPSDKHREIVHRLIWNGKGEQNFGST